MLVDLLTDSVARTRANAAGEWYFHLRQSGFHLRMESDWWLWLEMETIDDTTQAITLTLLMIEARGQKNQ